MQPNHEFPASALRCFLRREDGVATVDWVMLMCGATATAILAINMGQDTFGDYSGDVRDEIQSPYFVTDWTDNVEIPPSETWGEGTTIAYTGDGTNQIYTDTFGTTTGGTGTGGGGTDTGGTDTGGTDTGGTDTGGTDTGGTDTGGTDTGGTTGGTGGGTTMVCPDGTQVGNQVTTTGQDFWSPNNYTVTAGGDTQLSSCAGLPGSGYVNATPHYSFTLSAMEGYNRLEIEVWGNCDTTLLVLDPTGTWHFDDDSNGNYQPEINLTNTADLNGEIHVWVGTFGDASCSATLQMETW